MKKKSLIGEIGRFLGSKLFFWIIIVLFGLESLWIALSFRYPLLFDEHFHFTLIQFFSHRISPIVTSQPPTADVFGDLTHGGSTLYHYLMSFPYRLITHFTSSLPLQVIALRLINILMFGAGLVLFARLFEKLKIRRSLVNVALLFFILLPIVPYLAATINYDNMLFLLVAWFMLVCADVFIYKRIDWKTYAGIISIGCVATLVKFAFAPIFFVAAIYIAVLVWQRYSKRFFAGIMQSVKRTPKLVALVVATPTLLSVALFAQVYLYDIAVYHNPQPSCARVFALSRCAKSPMGQRDVQLTATKDQRTALPLPGYSLEWLRQMEASLNITAVNMHSEGTGTVYGAPLPFVYLVTFSVSIIGPAVLLYAWRSIEKKPMFYFFIAVAAVYTLAVFKVDMGSYYKYNEAIAIQPRYLLQILLPVLVLMMLAFDFVLRRYRYLKLGIFIVVLGVYLNGAGVITHIVRSNSTWYWQRAPVINTNEVAQRLLKPIIKEKSNL